LGFANGLRVISLACLVTLAGVNVQPALAADPSPSPSPATTGDPSPTPIPPLVDASATTTPPTAPTLPVAVQPTATVSLAVVKPDLAARVVAIAVAQRGKRYARGSMGPRAFDCSGLVLYAYRRAGVANHIGGGHSARGMLRWARAHGRASRSNPQVGDIVIYGGGTHAAIYIGHGLVISALNPRKGIRITGLHALGAPFTTFIHTNL
jgi:peptidoglycan DL-endopeptidase CwlO